MPKQTIRPGKTESRIGFFIGALFTFFGVAMLLMGHLTPLPVILLVPFGILWTFISGFNTYRAYKNGFTDEGMPYYEIRSEGGSDFEGKLRQLERLKADGLITELEYQQKRREIMAQEW